MENLYRELLTEIGEDCNRPGLVGTPKRCNKAMQFLTKGYHENVEEILHGAIFESPNDEMVVVRDIEVYSLCEHHLLPFFGICHIGYIPTGKIIGISKFARIVEVFSRRLQVQENLTQQIAETVLHYSGAQGVGVVMEMRHLCMMMRGVEKQRSLMATSAMLGVFRSSPSTRAEFLSLIRTSRDNI